MKEEKQTKNGIAGISTGFHELNNLIKGLNKGSLNVIASKPATGKTTLLLSIVKNIVLKEKRNVAIFSLEMSKEAVINKFLCNHAMLDLNKAIISQPEQEKCINRLSTIKLQSESEIYIYDKPGITIEQISKKCTKLKEDKNIDLIAIDYLQLITTEEIEKSKEQEKSKIASELKELAKELNIPIIITSQLSKDLESRENKTPALSDFKYSSSLKQYADVIMFLFRNNKSFENKDMVELIVAKNEYGDTGTIKLKML